MKSLQLFYRVTIMLGTLVVGALAYRAYGPQLEKLEPLFNRAKQVLAEAWNEDSPGAETLETAETEPMGIDQSDFDRGDKLQPFPMDQPGGVVKHVDWEDQLPSPIETPEPAPSPVASVVRQLESMGVSDCSLNTWGDSGDFFRFRCSLPWISGLGTSVHFEAISEDPADAAQQVLNQVSQWRLAHASEQVLR
ncbi:hypothetical protein [Aeoliella mucimassa]|uniref:Uncharacterized protein n=1 Tax=Aeoliella mucimassa TaxID=2527972 RepID=A0A518AWR4_9BACT|nr:hypothetical protein [Aeoliella mucimassa]QDU59172.1 hypothetical protein Pan181_54130 [Aeoliella mucimassa]